MDIHQKIESIIKDLHKLNIALENKEITTNEIIFNLIQKKKSIDSIIAHVLEQEKEKIINQFKNKRE